MSEKEPLKWTYFAKKQPGMDGYGQLIQTWDHFLAEPCTTRSGKLRQMYGANIKRREAH